MDQEEIPQPTSGIPRLSKLPLPRSISTQTTQNDVQLPSRRRPMSLYGSLPPPSQTSTAPQKTSTSDLGSSAAKDGDLNGHSIANTRKPFSPPSKLPASNTILRRDIDTNASSQAPNIEHSGTGVSRKASQKSRLSLSDRTIGTLAQIPPSPTSNRRQSGFFAVESPIRTPSRPASAFSRPISKSATAAASHGSIPERPVSPSISQSAMPKPIGSKLVAPGRRAVTSVIGKSYQRDIDQASSEFGAPQRQSTVPTSSNGAHSLKHSRMRPPNDLSKSRSAYDRPLKTVANPLPKPESMTNGKSVATSAATISPPKFPSKDMSSVSSPKSKVSPQIGTSTSSNALRHVIANAKAAKRATSRGGKASTVPRSAVPVLAGSDIDPFTLDLHKSAETNILRKRINTARSDGRLNISGLGLVILPPEVLFMFDSNAVGSSSVSWYECVDLVKLLASDNEITSLDPGGFPDVPHETDPFHDGDGDEKNSINHVFASLQTLDLHSNRLTGLPLGIRRLNYLTTLNLFRNQLTGDEIDLISQIPSLRELRLGENAIKGAFPDSVGNMKALEILDIHNNAITVLPELISRCSKLSSLDVSDNKLSSLPIDALADLPITELKASQNKLGGRFFPPKTRFATLRVLNVEENALIEIAGAEVDLPNLHTLNISNNRIASIANIEAWKRLKTVIASRDQFTSVPENVFSLPLLETLDLQNNSITQVDRRLGSISTLQTVRFEGNPIRERRLLTISTPDLLQELKIPETLLSPLSPKTPAPWTLVASTLDISRKKITEISKSDIMPFLSDDKEVRTLILHQNALSVIPTSISLLAQSLTTLDLSSNKLSTSPSYLVGSLSLPLLQTLNLTSNALTSLEPLTTFLSATSLSTLNISFNRLESLPPLKPTFPSLTTLLASNNKIIELDVETVKGLHVVDVSSNEITHLPPLLATCKGVLRTLMVSGNRFRVPGWGVLEKGTEEVLKWLEGRIPAPEAGADVD